MGVFQEVFNKLPDATTCEYDISKLYEYIYDMMDDKGWLYTFTFERHFNGEDYEWFLRSIDKSTDTNIVNVTVQHQD